MDIISDNMSVLLKTQTFLKGFVVYNLGCKNLARNIKLLMIIFTSKVKIGNMSDMHLYSDTTATAVTEWTSWATIHIDGLTLYSAS